MGRLPKVVGLLVAFALLLVACDWPVVPRPTPVTTPTTVLMPTNGATSTPATPEISACKAADLRAVAGWQGATGSLAGAVSLTNKTATACFLQGRPGLHITDAQGNMLPITNLEEPGKGDNPVLLPLGGKAFARFVWADWCGKSQGPYKVAVALPGEGGQLTVPALDPRGTPLSDTPRCDDSSVASTISVSPFEPPP